MTHDQTRYVRKKRARVLKNVVILILGCLVAVMFLWPIYIIFVNSFKTTAEISSGNVLALPQQITFENFVLVEEVTAMSKKILNSLVIGVSVTFLTVFLAFINAYVISIGKISIKGKYVGTFLLFFFLFAMLIPPASIIFPVYYGLRFVKLYNTIYAVILVEVCYWLGFSTFLLSNVLKAFPKDLVDAALVDGASQKAIMFRIILPLISSTITTLLTIFFVWSWNNFFFPLTLTISNRLFTMPLGLLYFINTFQVNEGAILAGAAIVSIPMIVFFLIFQRRITSGVMAGGLKG